MSYHSFRWVKKFDYQKVVSVLLTVLLVFQIISGVFLFVPLPKQAQAANQTWSMTTANNYTFDSDKIEISSGQAQLKATNTPAWYNTDWKYRKKITIDHTKVSADLTNFPVYLDLSSDPDLAAHAQADGDDILFTSSDGVTKLDHDLSISRATSTAELPFDGAWCWFQDPRAVHYKGTYNKTYAGWVNKNGDVLIGSYNHSTGDINQFTLHSALQYDDHAAPSILVRPDGHLMVFYSAHNGQSMYYRLSTNPENISSWGAEQTVGTNTSGGNGYSYPNPVQLSSESNKIYLFWRGGNWEPSFSTSTDGISWSTAHTLFNVPDQRPYMKVVSNGTDKIHFVFTDGHPASVANNNIYYAYYYNGAFYKADGTLIKTMADVVTGSPLLPAEIDKVYDATSGGSRAWIWDIALDSSGYPILVYANFPSTTDHRYRYARWTGSTWVDHEITAAGGYIDGAEEPYYSGGIALDHENPSIVYLSKEINGVHEIEKWTTSDGGSTWSSETITSESDKNNVRPIVPRGYTSGNLGAIWMYGDYPSYTTYDTALRMHPPIEIGKTAEVSEAYVKIPFLSSTTDTEIYMYYGNATSSDQSNPTGVWDSNFKMVQHLNDGATNYYTDDSTTNNNNGVKKASNEPNEVSEKINKAQDFDGVKDYINCKDGINMASWNALTAEAWVKYEKGTKTDKYTIISNWKNDVASILLRIDPAGDFIEAYVVTQTNTTIGGEFTDLVLDSNWHHVLITYNTTDGLKAYLDGTVSTTSYSSSANLDAGTSTALYIGYTPHEAADRFKGRIDEVRISNIARSTDWISTEYNNQNSPSTFYSVGSEETVYYSDSPTIQPTAANSLTFSSLSAFTETATKNGGEIKYQISNDAGATWYWYNSGWTTTTSGYSEANTASDINTNISSFPLGSGEFLFKTYLHSDGTQMVQLDSIDLTYANTKTLIYTAGAHGSITGDSPQTVNYGSDGTAVTAVPDTGYYFVSWDDDSTDNPRTDTGVTSDISVTANFAINTYTLTYTAGANGSISGTNPQTVDYGADGSAVMAVADSGYEFSSWSDSSTQNPKTDTGVTANVSVMAIFTATAPTIYTITASAISNGSILPSGATTVNSGDNQTFTITASSGYHISDIVVDGTSVGAVSLYTFNNVTTDHTISTTFAVTSSGGGGMPGAWFNPPSTPAPSPKNPQGGFNILINSGEETANNRNVILKLFAGDDTKRMSISEDPGFKYASQEPYLFTKAWELSKGDGKKTVYAKFFTQYGQPSKPVSANIILVEDEGDSRLRGNDKKENGNDREKNRNNKNKIFAYEKPRLASLSEEQNIAKDLKNKLEEHYEKNKIPVARKHWPTIVNSYVYGNYPIKAIIKAIKFGGKTVHPTIPYSAWQRAKDYIDYIDK